MTLVPKFIRRWLYRKMITRLKEVETADYNVFLCVMVREFTLITDIRSYPELWDRRRQCPNKRGISEGKYTWWFENNQQRLQYVKEALYLVS